MIILTLRFFHEHIYQSVAIIFDDIYYEYMNIPIDPYQWLISTKKLKSTAMKNILNNVSHLAPHRGDSTRLWKNICHRKISSERNRRCCLGVTSESRETLGFGRHGPNQGETGSHEKLSSVGWLVSWWPGITYAPWPKIKCLRALCGEHMNQLFVHFSVQAP